MGNVKTCAENLLNSIRNHDVYREYVERENMVSSNPKLKAEIDVLRRNSFLMYQKEDWFDEADRLNEQFAELRKVPEVNAYLEAEADLCKMIREIQAYVVTSLNIQIPEV